MPRFLHAADLHLDSPLQGLAKLDGAPVERLRGATRLAFQRLVDTALRERVAFVLLCGDVFDTNPAVHSAQFLIHQLERLTKAGIRVFAVLGNHDFGGLFPDGLRAPEGVHLFSRQRPETVKLDAIAVALHGRSYETNEPTGDLSGDYPAPIPGWLNVGLLHTALDGGDTNHGKYAPVPADTLAKKGYQYWALGHVHKASKPVIGGVHIVFPGNLQGRHARETGSKGCELVTFDGARILDVTHVSLDVVRWHEVRVDVAGIASWGEVEGRAETAIGEGLRASRSVDRLDVVRVVLTGRTAHAADLEARLEDIEDGVRLRLKDSGAWLERVKSEVAGGVEARDPGPARVQLESVRRTVLDDPKAVTAALLEGLDALQKDPELRDLLQRRLSREAGLALPRRGEPFPREVLEALFDRAVAFVDAKLGEG